MSIGLKVFEYFFIATFATLNHFAYDISGHMFIFSLIGAVNESVWEHEKMGIVPWLLWFLVKKFIFGYEVNFCQVFLAIFAFINTISIVYYTYTHFTGHYVVKIDISSFFLAVGMGMMAENYAANLVKYNMYGLAGIIFIIFMLLKNTHYPFHIFYFLDEGANLYGLDAHKYRCEIPGQDQLNIIKNLRKKEKEEKAKKAKKVE